ncbi:hypothetical protein LEP1GSC088_1509 [Leptospira interrogans str. L1207]|nr:hypothetical protein LEP1GSC088_1509 [Leptospira interrogans str. L1207]
MMSHEIRTLLNGVIGTVSFFRRNFFKYRTKGILRYYQIKRTEFAHFVKRHSRSF